MKKIAIGLALLIGSVAAAQAAPAQNPYCKFANAQRNSVSWNAYYGCLKLPPYRAKAAAHKPVRTARAKSPYCAMASAQRNMVSWNSYYHCLDR